MKTNHKRGYTAKRYSHRNFAHHKQFVENKATEGGMDKQFGCEISFHPLGVHIDVAYKRGAKKNIRQRRRYYEKSFCKKQYNEEIEV